MDQQEFEALSPDVKLNEIYRILPKPTPDARGHAGMEQVFGRPDEPNLPPEPLNEHFQEVFGRLRGPRGQLLLTNTELNTWNRLYSGWEGFKDVPAPAAKVLALVAEHYAGLGEFHGRVLAFGLNGQVFLTFPDLPGSKYGTLECFKVGAILFGLQSLDGALKIIEKLR